MHDKTLSQSDPLFTFISSHQEFLHVSKPESSRLPRIFRRRNSDDSELLFLNTVDDEGLVNWSVSPSQSESVGLSRGQAESVGVSRGQSESV